MTCLANFRPQSITGIALVHLVDVKEWRGIAQWWNARFAIVKTWVLVSL